MKDNQEFEKWLNVEIPQNVIQPEQIMKNHHLQQNPFHHQSSPNQPIHGMSGMYEDDPSFHHQYSTLSSSPVSGFSLLSESSNSSSLPSDGFPGFHETSPRFEETKTQTPNRNTHYSNGFGLESKLPNTPMGTDELGLSGLLSGMKIRDGHDDLTINGHLPNNGFQFNDRSSMMTTNNGNVENRRIQSYYHASPMNLDEEMRVASMMTHNGNVDNSRIQSSYPASPMNFDEEMRAAFLDLQEIFQFADLSEGYTYDNGLYPYLDDYTCSMRTPLKGAMENFRVDRISKEDLQFQSDAVSFQNLNNRRIQEQILYSAQNGTYCNKARGVLDSPSSPQLTNTNLSLGFGGRLLHTPPMSNRRPEITSNGRFLHSPSSVNSAGGLEVSSGEDSLIIQGQSSKNYVYKKSCDISREHKKHSFNAICTGNHSASSSQLDCLSHSGGIPFANCEDSRSPKIYHPHLGQPKCKSSWEVQGCIYFLAKHQQGCRLLQQKFDKRNPQYVNMIFNGIINHVSELMMDPFGNYLMQKLLDVCTEGQRTDILLMITREPDELVRISLNTHGTRVVQKLIQTLKTRQQISQVIAALEFGFIDLIKDLNGNHVVQSCLNSLSSEDNKFIFSAAAKFCLEIATHQHGCCVLQRCIDHSTGEHRENLVAKIAANGLLLAQDAYGNYVVQYIIGRKIPYVTKTLVSQFQGKYVHLSMQKYSSNVVEKCLKEFNEENRFKIIHELFSDPRFDQLLQHQFANYVVQTAIVVSKGALHSSLVGAILPHEERLKNNIYSKKLFSRSRLVK